MEVGPAQDDEVVVLRVEEALVVGVVVVVAGVDFGVEEGAAEEEGEEDVAALEDLGVETMPSKGVARTSQFSSVLSVVSITEDEPSVKYRVKAA